MLPGESAKPNSNHFPDVLHSREFLIGVSPAHSRRACNSRLAQLAIALAGIGERIGSFVADVPNDPATFVNVDPAADC